MIAASNSNNHADLPQAPRQSLAKSHDDGDVKYFFQRPEQDLNSRQNSKWSGDDSALEQVNLSHYFVLNVKLVPGPSKIISFSFFDQTSKGSWRIYQIYYT